MARDVEAHLEAAERLLQSLRGRRGPHLATDTLQLYDDILVHVDAAGNRCALFERVHPDAEVRQVAERWTLEVSQFATRLSLDRDVYEALAALDVRDEDAATRYYVERTLRDFRRAGVDRDEPTRARIQELNDALTLVGQDFARNIQIDRRTVDVGPEDLLGLPEDYIRSHPPGPDGRIIISTDYPDYSPFMSYSRGGAARERLYRAFRLRAHPANIEVLQRMLELRWELAHLLGYRSWAHYVTEDKMIGSDVAAREFLERVTRIAARRSAQDYEQLLRRKRADDPPADEVRAWESSYYEERVKSELYNHDSQAVRAYFPYERVRDGVLQVTSRLFGVEYRRIEAPDVWSPDVESYDLYEAGERLGRLHLDMHPRSDKYKHAAQFTLQNGVLGRQLPEAALVCNFPGGEPGDPGLLEHDDVTTFFHEFGHLLHNLFAGRQRWMGIAGIGTEWDFVEAPSQMLEEWAWDPATLQSFARHYATGEPIPVELVQRAKAARDFGKGAYVRQQMFYAMLSLGLYDRDPAEIDAQRMVRELQDACSPYRYVDETWFHLSFGHLDGYSAMYYTYMWSLVIAKDLFSRFDRADLLAPEVARRYREAILDPGGSAPAAQLVQRFLGRPFGFEAYQSWLDAG